MRFFLNLNQMHQNQHDSIPNMYALKYNQFIDRNRTTEAEQQQINIL